MTSSSATPPEPLLLVPRDRPRWSSSASSPRTSWRCTKPARTTRTASRSGQEERKGHPARRHPVPPVLHGQGHRRRCRLPDGFLGDHVLRPEGGGYFPGNAFYPADPAEDPPHIAPVWYFTPFYSILRAVVWPIFGIDAKFWAWSRWAPRWSSSPSCRGWTAAGQVDPLPRSDLRPS